MRLPAVGGLFLAKGQEVVAAYPAVSGFSLEFPTKMIA